MKDSLAWQALNHRLDDPGRLLVPIKDRDA
jgi:hypothetical protein